MREHQIKALAGNRTITTIVEAGNPPPTPQQLNTREPKRNRTHVNKIRLRTETERLEPKNTAPPPATPQHHHHFPVAETETT
jgi:hypothetical protein